MSSAADAVTPSTARRLVDLLLEALATAAALAAVVLSATARQTAVPLVLAALIAVAALCSGRLGVPTRPDRVLGQRLVPRAALVLGVGACAAGTGGTAQRVLVAIAVLGLLGLLAVEPYLGRAVRAGTPVVAHLPGIRPARADQSRPLATVGASIAATGVGLVGVSLDASNAWWLAAVLAAAVPALLTAVASRRKMLDLRRLRRDLPGAVAAYAPEFVVYTSRPDDASYQVTMWLPYLQRTGRRFLIITRNSEPARALAALTDVPVVEARRTVDLEGLVTPALQAALYVNASSGNGALVRYQHLTHIYIGHGDSDKPPSYNPTHAMYDKVFTAGAAASRRYAAHGVKIPADKFQVVGRPQVEDVHPATRAIAEAANPIVLYAPTWRGHVEETMLYSLPRGEEIVTALLARGATVVFRPHPFSREFADDAAAVSRIQQLLANDTSATGRRHVWGPPAESGSSILELMNTSDAMVTDVSSVVSDYLFSGKPFAMVAVPAEPDVFVEEYPVARASYVVRGDLDGLDDQLEAMLGEDPLAERRRQIRVDYLGDFPTETYASAFVEAVQQISAKDVENLDLEEPSEGSEVTESGGLSRSGEASGSVEGAESDDPGAVGADLAAAGHRLLDGGPPVGSGSVARYLTAFAAQLWQLGSAALACLTFVLALGGVPAGVVALLGVVALGVAWGTRSSTFAGPAGWARLLGTAPLARSVLLGTAALLVAERGLVGTAWTAAFLLLAATLVAEQHLRAAWTRAEPIVVGLPGLHGKPRELVPRGALALLDGLAVVLSLVLVVLDAPGWALLALALVGVTLLIAALVPALVGARRAAEAESGLRTALTAHAPQFAVYFASTAGARYQIGMWLPYFVRIGRPFVVVTRTASMQRQTLALCAEKGVDVPVLLRPTLRSLEDCIVPSMSVAFYVNNAVRNTHFIERRELTHVWLNHGDSEKPACYNPVHAIYDLIFAAGQAAVDRYDRHGVQIPREKFVIVGRPQVETIRGALGPITDRQPPTVLYAPTWQGPYADTRVYSLPQGRHIVQQLLDRGVRVVFRAHPFNYRYPEARALVEEIGTLLSRDRARTGREHVWGAAAEQDLTIEDCFNISDAMVSDVSAVVSDYLRSEKPFAIVAVGRTIEQLVAEVPAAAAAYVVRDDLSNLGNVLGDLLKDDDPLGPVRRRTRQYYLGSFAAGQDAEGFLRSARSVIDRQLPGADKVHPEPVVSGSSTRD